MNILIYSKANCPNCDTAVQLLQRHSLAYTEVDIEAEEDRRRALLAQYPEARQMPQVFINGQRVGGLAGLQAALRQVGVIG